MPPRAVGILGVGVHLPPTRRPNGWWPAEVVAAWHRPPPPGPPPPAPTTAAGRAIAQAMAADPDPFAGVRARHVLAPEFDAIDMEELAARAALDHAGCTPAQVDLVLAHSPVPAVLHGNPACELHHRLGLRATAPSLEVTAAGYAFLAQLAVAHAMITAGAATTALLVQSALGSRLNHPTDPLSGRFGDAATAVVVGAVADGFGLRSAAHRTDGATPHTLVATTASGRWYDAGPVQMTVPDPMAMRRLLLDTVDRGCEVVAAALAQAALPAAAVDVFLAHQGAAWLQALTREHAGLVKAATVDSYADTAHIGAASVPLDLRLAWDRGLLTSGAEVVLFAGGTGMTYGATVLRWGGQL
ncbi:MAG: 3-oxoacyl-[acyl-carrier-protein] synthase III C-terminal domain-containing protein [Kofleriaceae bacterium]